MLSNIFRSMRDPLAYTTRTLVALTLTLLLAALVGPAVAYAAPQDDEAQEQEQQADQAQEPELEEAPRFHSETTVTATGTAVETFETPYSISVFEAEEIEQLQPDTAVDLLYQEPGVDVNGIGPNQKRPIIRGERGLRVLYLEDGMRMNNARRQTDFGEIPGLTSVANIERVEVVRGPASVLWGEGAVGGVINLITRAVPPGEGVKGRIGLRYGTVDDQSTVTASVSGRSGNLGYEVGGSIRDYQDYEAPAGTFGQIELVEDVTVNDTALEDDSAYARLGYDLADNKTLFFRFNRYRADQTGFGWVDPLLLGELDTVQILYPEQKFDKFAAGYRATGIDSALADNLSFQAIWQKNERFLVNDIDTYSPFFFFGPGIYFHVTVDTEGFTDLDTLGGRLEATKILGDKQLLTYGAEYYQDDSVNTDFAQTVGLLSLQIFPGTIPIDITPPFFSVIDDVANTPNADNINYGAFVQDEIYFTDKFSAIFGLRYAKSETKANSTPGLNTAGLDFDDDAVVGAANFIYRATDNLHLVGTYGTAFRAPNIVERLFNGPTPEGSGFQVLNANLASEESENYDLGFKYLGSKGYFQATYFENEISDATVQASLTPAEIAQLPPDLQAQIEQGGFTVVVQQRNADTLTIDGIELMGVWNFDNGITLGGNYTEISGKSRTGGEAADPTGQTFSEKYNAYLRYQKRRGMPVWVEYRVRRNGEEDAALDPGEEPSPVGPVFPSFTVHTLSGGVTFLERDLHSHSITLAFENLTDELYAEASNTLFFRPAPGFNAKLTYSLTLGR